MKLKDEVHTLEDFIKLMSSGGKDIPRPAQINKPHLGKIVRAGPGPLLRSVHLHKVSPPEGCIFLAQEDDLILFAKEILHKLDPTPLEQLVEVLRDIERKTPDPPIHLGPAKD